MIKAPGRNQVPEELIEWMDERSEALFLSTVSVAEVCSGIALLERSRAIDRAAQSTGWLDGDRVIPFDNVAARIAGHSWTGRVRRVIRLDLPTLPSRHRPAVVT